MVLEFKHFDEIAVLIRFPYYYNLCGIDPHHASLSELRSWAEEIEMHIVYCGGSLYFKTDHDLLAFQIKWC